MLKKAITITLRSVSMMPTEWSASCLVAVSLQVVATTRRYFLMHFSPRQSVCSKR